MRRWPCDELSATILSEVGAMVDQHVVDEFHQAMIGIYHDAKRLAGYNATYFYRMVLTDGGIETARRLLASSQLSSGLAELWQKGHLEISMESVVLQQRFGELFTDDERDIARRRLTALGYTVSR
jgi:hypothetical protein